MVYFVVVNRTLLRVNVQPSSSKYLFDVVGQPRLFHLLPPSRRFLLDGRTGSDILKCDYHIPPASDLRTSIPLT